MSLWTWVCKYLFVTLLSILLGIYFEVELLDHMGILILTFWATIFLFFILDALFFILTNNALGFQFLNILANTCYILCVGFFLNDSHLQRCDMVPHCGSDFYFPKIKIVLLNTFSHNDWPFLISSFEKCLFKSFAYFKNQIVYFSVEL